MSSGHDEEPRRSEVLQSLQRALRLLDVIGSREVGVSELARELSLSKSTVFRLLSTLRASGYVEQDRQTERYRLGLRLLDLGQIVASGLKVNRVALPIMVELAERSQATVFLAVLVRGAVVNVEQVESSAPLRVVAEEVHFRQLPHTTATGKVLLAALPPATRQRMLDTIELSALTPRSIVNRVALEAVLAQVDLQGYAINDEEQVIGVRGVAVPVRDHRSYVVAALSVAAPTSLLTRDRTDQFVRWVSDAAAEISRRLGAPQLP
ncbi:MAG: IclR family transcriptional regulator [Chloroflexi bacterium]|nr:IclR family transcriptional regulator [Chloroflexota bacterium]